jgi:hypothetical protein
MPSQKNLFYLATLPLLGILLGIAIYCPSFQAPFQFDDYFTIIENPSIKSLNNVTWIWRHDPSRFFTYLSFAVNYHFH